MPTVVSSREVLQWPEEAVDWTLLIKGNAKCLHLKKILPVKGLCGRCLSAVAQNPIPLPLTHCIRVYIILIHIGKGGAELNHREG
jgi:hypothetical protein